MGKYYSEEMVKDTKYRQDYLGGLDAWLQEQKTAAAEKRAAFITPEKYAADTEGYREKFVQMLGFPLTEARVMPTAEKTFVTRDQNVDIYRMQFTFFGKLKFYGMYFEQIEKKENTPFVFGFHGGGGTPEMVSSMHRDSSNYNHLVRRITDRGANVFSPQFLLWNVDNYGNPFNRQNVDGKLRQLGGSITALEVYFLRCILDWFLANERVNADKIGAAGLSYGGMYTAHFAAAEPRIKAAYSCSWVDDIFVNSWADWSYLNAQYAFTTAETLALVAPRALFVGMGDKDELFDHKRTAIECEKAARYFKALEKEENFRWKIFDGTHETDKEDEWLDFLFEKLK